MSVTHLYARECLVLCVPCIQLRIAAFRGCHYCTIQLKRGICIVMFMIVVKYYFVLTMERAHLSLRRQHNIAQVGFLLSTREGVHLFQRCPVRYDLVLDMARK